MDLKCVAINVGAVALGAYAGYRFVPGHKKVGAAAGAAGGFAIASFLLGCKLWDETPVMVALPATPEGVPTTPPILQAISPDGAPMLTPKPLIVPAKTFKLPLTFSKTVMPTQIAPSGSGLSTLVARLQAGIASAMPGAKKVAVIKQTQPVSIKPAGVITQEQLYKTCYDGCIVEHKGQWSPNMWLYCERTCKEQTGLPQPVSQVQGAQMKDPACMKACSDNNPADFIASGMCKDRCPVITVSSGTLSNLLARASAVLTPSKTTASPAAVPAYAPKQTPSAVSTTSSVVAPSSTGVFRLVAAPTTNTSKTSIPAGTSAGVQPVPVT
ncbi:MAG: hypothetical protein WC683_02510 [bacterium]